MKHLLSHKVVPIVADAGVQIPVVGRVLRAFYTLPCNFDVFWLTEAAALIEVLVVTTGRVNNRRARLSLSVIDFVVLTPSTRSVDQVVPEDAHTGLLCVRVDLVFPADHFNAVIGSGEDGVSRTTSAFIKLRIIGLVVGAALANILDNDETWLALAGSVDEDLVGSTCVNSYAPLSNLVVGVSGRTLATNSTDAIEIRNAVAKESVKIEYLILFAAVAVIIGAGGNLDCGFTALAVVGVY